MTGITKAERSELKGVVRNQFKVLRSEVDQREVELLADVETQISDAWYVVEALSDTGMTIAERSYVCEGWWHPNVKSGQVHDHPEEPGRGWSIASHRLCEHVYTARPQVPT